MLMYLFDPIWSYLTLISSYLQSYLICSFFSCPNDSVHLIPSNLVHLPYLPYLYIYVAYLINVLCIICLYPSQRPCLSRFFLSVLSILFLVYVYIYTHTLTYTYKIIYTYNIILLYIYTLYNLLSSSQLYSNLL